MITPSFREAFLYFFRLGFINFGGPAGQIALMHREIVDEKRWLDEPHFQHALNFCTLLPGPEAMQLATYIGWLWGGVRLGLIAGLFFVLPGALVLIGLATLYVYAVDIQWVQGFFAGLQAAVLALICHALVRLSKRNLKSHLSWALSIGALAAQLIFGLSFIVILLLAVIIAILFDRQPAQALVASALPRTQWKKTLMTFVLWALLWVVPAGYFLLGSDVLLAQLTSIFSQASLFSFGGAYAVLPYVHEQMVHVDKLIDSKQMLDGLALGESTPGPLILVNVFVAFVAGWNVNPDWSYALVAALVALWFNFLPSFLFIFVGAPWVEQTRHLPHWQTPLRAINAVVIGMLCGLFLLLAQHVIGPLQQLALDKLLLATLAAFALIRWQWNLMLVLLICGAVGIAKTVFIGF